MMAKLSCVTIVIARNIFAHSRFLRLFRVHCILRSTVISTILHRCRVIAHFSSRFGRLPHSHAAVGSVSPFAVAVPLLCVRFWLRLWPGLPTIKISERDSSNAIFWCKCAYTLFSRFRAVFFPHLNAPPRSPQQNEWIPKPNEVPAQ